MHASSVLQRRAGRTPAGSDERPRGESLRTSSTGASVMPRDRSSVAGSGEIQGGALAGNRLIRGLPVNLNAADAHLSRGRKNLSSSSRRMVPEISVPVTTVPNPFMVKTRSMGRRAMARESLGCASRGGGHESPL